MPNLTIKKFVDFFWVTFDEIFDSGSKDTEHAYEQLLVSVLDISKDILSTLDKDDEVSGLGSSKVNLPLLAMISEIQLVAPGVVAKVAGNSVSTKKALSILENYSTEKKLLLRKKFLYREQADVYLFDDFRK